MNTNSVKVGTGDIYFLSWDYYRPAALCWDYQWIDGKEMKLGERKKLLCFRDFFKRRQTNEIRENCVPEFH